MYPEQRQRQIAALAREHGRVEVSHLAELLDVTTETIRRDLTRLERLGELRRVHGGAIPLDRLGFEPGIDTRAATMTAEKERIAKAAVQEVPEAGTILLDAGTTTLQLATALPTDRELTVVTNALDIARLLSARDNITLLMVGGRIRGRTLAAVDAWAAAMLRELYVDVAFMAANGISVERGLTTPDSTEAEAKRLMIAAARRTVLLADHTKVGNDTLVRFADLDRVDTLITDTGLDAGLLDELEQAGLRVVTA